MFSVLAKLWRVVSGLFRDNKLLLRITLWYFSVLAKWSVVQHRISGIVRYSIINYPSSHFSIKCLVLYNSSCLSPRIILLHADVQTYLFRNFDAIHWMSLGSLNWTKKLANKINYFFPLGWFSIHFLTNFLDSHLNIKSLEKIIFVLRPFYKFSHSKLTAIISSGRQMRQAWSI